MNPSSRYRAECDLKLTYYCGESFVGKDCSHWIKGFCNFKGECAFKTGDKI